MNLLQKKCLFVQEDSAEVPQDRVDVPALTAMVDRGRASFVDVADPAEVSFSVKEKFQEDVASLPCGARTLLVRRADGHIVSRGLNKFVDMSAVVASWAADAELWRRCRVWAQRKMAGFVVTVHSPDGRALRVMSKHAEVGEHAALAHGILRRQQSDAQAQRMAADLHAWGASAAFECIAAADMTRHPAPESECFRDRLVLLCIQKNTRREVSLAAAALANIGERWGVPCAPARELHSHAELLDAVRCVRQWNAVYDPFGPHRALAEGFVILIELEARGALDAGRESADATPVWWRPVRLKLKTARYVVLRSLRSWALAESQPRLLLVHHAVALWAATHRPDFADRVARLGVSAAFGEFEEWVRAQRGVRFRDADDTVSGAYRKVLEKSAAAAVAPLLDTAGDNQDKRGQLDLITLCGLPGCGKSTLAAAIVHAACRAHRTCFHSIACVSRDSVTARVYAEHGVTSQTSSHKLRRMGSHVHAAMRAELLAVAAHTQREATVATGARTCLVLDGCHLTPSARLYWPRLLRSSGALRSHTVVYLSCGPDRELLLRRVTGRRDHETIHNAEQAQQALFALAKKLVPPTDAETGVDRLVHLDTRHISSEAAAAAVLQAFTGHERTRLCTSADLQGTSHADDAALLYSVLGVKDATLETPMTPFAPRPPSATLPHHHAQGTVALLTLPSECQTVLWEAAAAALAPLAADAASGSVPTLLRGHARWLPGWIFHGAPREAEALLPRLRERFEHQPSAPHVTLAVADTAEALHALLARAAVAPGARVAVAAHTLYMDREALCLGVSLRPPELARDLCIGFPHITLGTKEGTAFRYAMMLEAQTAQWEDENQQLSANKDDAKRSTTKFHNFVTIKLPQSLVLEGVVMIGSRK